MWNVLTTVDAVNTDSITKCILLSINCHHMFRFKFLHFLGCSVKYNFTL